MSILNNSMPFCALRPGHVVALAGGSGRLSVVDGRVWLTRPGDPDDHLLAAGDSIEVDDASRTLVEPWGGGAAVAWQRDALGARVRRRWQRLHVVTDAVPHNARFIENKDEGQGDGGLFRS